MNQIIFESGGIELLKRIHTLWQELKAHHVSVSTFFSDEFSRFSFEARKASLTKGLQSESLLAEIAVEPESNNDIGYCVCSIHPDRSGEIESIYVKPAFRNSGVGQELLTRGIQWLKAAKVTEIVVEVAYGNEDVFELYGKFNFFPRKTVLKQKTD